MTMAIPVIDLEAAEAGDVAQLDAVRAATEELGAVQVVSHGVPPDLAADLDARSPPWTRTSCCCSSTRTTRRSPSWRSGATTRDCRSRGRTGTWIGVPVIPGALQVFSGHLLARWTGGRLRPGRHRVVAGGTVTRRSTAVFVYPALETAVGTLAPFAGGSAAPPVLVWDHVKDRVAGYLAEYGRPDQIPAWRDGQPYVAELAKNSAGR